MAVFSDIAYESIDSLPLSLSLFMEKFSDRLPQVIAVNESIYGVSSGLFMEGQLLLVYFLKKTDVVSGRISGLTRVIPVNTSMKLAIPYDPHNDRHSANNGYIFSSVADMAKAKYLPPVVYVGQSWKASSKDSSSIEKGQVLIVKVNDARSRKKKRLICVDPTTHVQLSLEYSCIGHFSTQPSLALLNLQTLLQYFQLPVNVILYIKSSSPPIHCTLDKKFELKSIIASFCPPSSIDGDFLAVKEVPNEVIEVTSTTSIDVRIIKISEYNMRHFKINRDVLGAQLNLSFLTDIVSDASATADALQKQLLHSITEIQWKKDIIDANECNYETILTTADTMLETKDQCISNSSASEDAISVVDIPPPVPPRIQRSCETSISSKIPDIPKRLRSNTVGPTEKVILPVVIVKINYFACFRYL